MGVLEGIERGLAAFGLEKAVDHALAVGGRQIQRQAFGTEGRLDLVHQCFEVHPVGIDLIDDDHPAQPLLFRSRHQALCHEIDSVLRIDDDRGGIGGRQH